MSIALIAIIILVLAVVFVNGWTDAPNAIATVVSTKSMHPKKAVLMAAIFNFLGLLIMSFFNAKVAATIGNIVSFDSGEDSLIALAAGLFAIVVWAVAAWYFGIPTSESHALIAGVTGAGIAIVGISAVNISEWTKVLYGLVISSVVGVLSGFVTVKLVEFIFKRFQRAGTNEFFTGGQIASGAAMAFLHGAQDGQKFLGVYMLGMCLARGSSYSVIFRYPTICHILIFSSYGNWYFYRWLQDYKSCRYGYG